MYNALIFSDRAVEKKSKRETSLMSGKMTLKVKKGSEGDVQEKYELEEKGEEFSSNDKDAIRENEENLRKEKKVKFARDEQVFVYAQKDFGIIQEELEAYFEQVRIVNMLAARRNIPNESGIISKGNECETSRGILKKNSKYKGLFKICNGEWRNNSRDIRMIRRNVYKKNLDKGLRKRLRRGRKMLFYKVGA